MSKSSWWKEVSGPSRFIDAAAKEVSEQKSTALIMPEDIPFEDDFYRLLSEKVGLELSGQSVDMIDNISGSIPDYFLNTYCRKELRALFRPKPGFSAAKFIAAAPTAVMHGRGFIVKVTGVDEYNEWLSFISDYASSVSSDIQPAVFVLCVHGDIMPKSTKGVKCIWYSDFSSHFDAYAYCAIRASDISEPALIKEYLADLASSIACGNVEQAEKAMYIYREFLDDPAAFAIRHFGVGEENEEAITKKVWESQLKCIFPRIEKYRCEFVERHEMDISPHIGSLKDPFGNPYESARDVELGSLFFMCRNGTLLLERNEYEKLKVFYNARNDLAHMNVIAISVIREIS